MNEFVIPSVRATATGTIDRVFPFERAVRLKSEFARVFSHHLGCLESGSRFETESLLVTGQSGSGKTKEIEELLKRFNAGNIRLPTGQPARFAECMLKGTLGWKDLGRNSMRAIGFPLSDRARLTQIEIWERVVTEAKLAGVVGIHYDEAQHIFRKKNETDRLAILDSFKTLMKSHDWPLMLIFSGVPELDGYLREEPQLYRLLNRIKFNDVSLPDDFDTVHEIVGSYALSSKLELDAGIPTEDFYHRLVVAGAYRWGLVIKLTIKAIGVARVKGASALNIGHFIDAWVNKTESNPAATPFTHSGYDTMFRKDHPYLEALND
ncbi:ATP-binding protein [Celeribacter sp.]|uniref:ATP-binding protein n=1 Tax=Celeribacter sp. TaxID=1890673 RepID=UPI003A8DC095